MLRWTARCCWACLPLPWLTCGALVRVRVQVAARMKLEKSMQNREVGRPGAHWPPWCTRPRAHARTHARTLSCNSASPCEVLCQRMEDENSKLRDEIERQSGEQTEVFAYLNKELRLVCARACSCRRISEAAAFRPAAAARLACNGIPAMPLLLVPLTNSLLRQHQRQSDSGT